jgi:plastocyanin
MTMTTTTRSMVAVFWAGTLALTAGCAGGETPLRPSSVSAAEVSVDASAPPTMSSTTTPTITLQPDLTVSPAQVTVSAGQDVVMVNRSGRNATIRASNCSEFNMMNVPKGGFQYSSIFNPAGKACDYYAWDVNWSRQIFIGRVVVQ